MKRATNAKLLAALFLFSSFLFSCSKENEVATGHVGLHITDAPTDASNVSGVFITITAVEYRKEGGNWQAFEGFSGPNTLNLLDLTEGKSELLGDFIVEAGTYTGLRFKLDAAENGGSANSNVASYIEFEGGERQPLYVPSGTKSGYKAFGSFTVPVNGAVSITADFDVRKSVVKAGTSGKYLLKPTIRLVVNDQAGSISGTFQGIEENYSYVVFAYAAGTYAESETDEPAEGEARFPQAVSSAGVNEDGSFIIPFMAPGDYDLVVVAFSEGSFQEVVSISTSPVTVSSEQTIEANIVF